MRFTKTLLSGATALALLAGPALAQQYPGQHPGQEMMPHDSQPPHDEPHGPQGNIDHADYHDDYHHGPSGPDGHWARGDHFDGHRDVIAHGDWGRYHLHQPPRGYEWVRSGNQFVMIAVTSGVIAGILAGSAD